MARVFGTGPGGAGHRLLWAACWLAMAAVMAAQPAPEEPEGRSSIEGKVVNQVTGEGIRKAEVRLGGRNRQLLAITDAEGRFRFENLTAGPYWLMVQREGFSPRDPLANGPQQITVGADERKTGVEVKLAPEARISGRLLDEDGSPVVNCSVMASQFDDSQPGGRRLAGRNGAQSDDKGEYSLASLPPGRYYVFANCRDRLPMPHPLLPPDDPRIRFLVSMPEFYPGAPDLAGATPLRLAPGDDRRGIDFQVRHVPAVMVRGELSGPGGLVQDTPSGVWLTPESSAAPELLSDNAGVQPGGKFSIALPRGSYVLTASTFGSEQVYRATLPIQVGDTAPEPIEVVLSPGAEVSGTVEFENDTASPPPPQPAPPAGGQPVKREIMLMELDRTPAPVPPRQAEIGADGTFTLTGLFPGKWRLNLNGVNGYVRSFTIADKSVTPYSFEIGPGTAGAWHIVVSNALGQVDVTVTGDLPAEPGAVSILLAPEDPDAVGAGMESIFGADEKAHAKGQARPGHYRAFALETRSGWTLSRRPKVLDALQSRSQEVDIQPGQRTSLTLDLVPAAELRRAMEEHE